MHVHMYMKTHKSTHIYTHIWIYTYIPLWIYTYIPTGGTSRRGSYYGLDANEVFQKEKQFEKTILSKSNLAPKGEEGGETKKSTRSVFEESARSSLFAPPTTMSRITRASGSYRTGSEGGWGGLGGVAGGGGIGRETKGDEGLKSIGGKRTEVSVKDSQRMTTKLNTSLTTQNPLRMQTSLNIIAPATFAAKPSPDIKAGAFVKGRILLFGFQKYRWTTNASAVSAVVPLFPV